jgi:FkbM family methyltransferase
MLTSLKQLITNYNCNITGVIHVGAHDGGETNDYINCNIDKIVYFEPLPDIFSILKEKIAPYPSIQAHNCALGASESVATFNISNNLYSSSLLKPKEHLKIHPGVTFTETINVDVKTLDSFNIQNYNFLNMDVQGYELEVLKGGQNTLNQIDYIFTEVNFQEVYENCALIEQLDDFLKVYNFTRVGTYNGVPGYWGDAFYIKSN